MPATDAIERCELAVGRDSHPEAQRFLRQQDVVDVVEVAPICRFSSRLTTDRPGVAEHVHKAAMAPEEPART